MEFAASGIISNMILVKNSNKILTLMKWHKIPYHPYKTFALRMFQLMSAASPRPVIDVITVLPRSCHILQTKFPEHYEAECLSQPAT